MLAAQEQARKEWLQYYLQIGNWEQASELVRARSRHSAVAAFASSEADHAAAPTFTRAARLPPSRLRLPLRAISGSWCSEIVGRK